MSILLRNTVLFASVFFMATGFNSEFLYAQNGNTRPATPVSAPVASTKPAPAKIAAPSAQKNFFTKKKEKPEEFTETIAKTKFSFGFWAGASNISQQETYSLDYSAQSVSFGGLAHWLITENFAAYTYFNAHLFPVLMDPETITARYYQAAIGIEYISSIIALPWQLPFRLGLYGAGSQVTNNDFGYQGLMGPEVSIPLRNYGERGQFIEFVPRMAIVKAAEGDVDFSNLEWSVGATWFAPSDISRRFFVCAEYRSLSFTVTPIISASQIAYLGAGLFW
jgi:hypothetical protein